MATIITTRLHGSVGRGLRKGLLSGVALGVIFAAAARAQQTADGTTAPDQTPPGKAATKTAPPPKAAGTENVIVTAQRRTQNLQDVPISIQVLSGATLKKLNIENFDDLIGQLPNVTQGGFGPGQVNVYMRGLSVGGDEGGQGGGGVGSFPNVAVYLDDQSAQVPGRNLDIYTADLQQVEVLEGPQGTLFGSGAQGGVLRYITNKPILDKFSATIDAGVAGTVHGAASKNIDATVNIPLVKDTAALRLTVYDDQRGGYIDNVPGTFVRQATDRGIHYAGYTNNIPGPATSTNSINNASLVQNNINPVNYVGTRGELLVKFDDDWNALLTQSVQNLNADGVFYETPQSSGSSPVKLPDLSVQLYEPTTDRDFFENTALTIDGRVGPLKLVYDGAYLIRNTNQVQDYTAYARGLYADYYQCQPANPAKGFPKAQCYSPGATWQDIEHDTHLSQEARISTPDSWRLRAIGGFFYEDFQIQNETNFNYLTAPGFTQLGPAPGSTVVDPNPRGPSTGFFNDITRGYSQYAIFGSADFDIIPKVLTVTAGTRWYDFHNFEKGSVVSGFGCSVFYTGGVPCTAGATNLDAKHLESAAYGFKSRANITWKITPDIMVYYTWSQGYRPAGFNRRAPSTDHGEFVGPIAYQSDTLTNNEVGYKMQFLDHRLTIDGAFYQENWNNVQDRLFDPGAFGNLAFTVNGPNYRVRGAEVQATAVPIDGLSVTGSFAANDTRQLTSPPVTSATGAALPGSVGIFGDVGDSLALSPAFKGDLRARYEFDVGNYLCFAQAGVTHSSHTHSAVANFNNFYQSPITTVNASVGVSKDDWRAQIYVDNLTNERGQEFISAAQFVQSIIVTRPLTAGLKVTYSFN
jgi:outer membrane receptor protein involved in Fe transport